MDKTLMHWRSWGLLGVFFARFGDLQPENDNIPPAQLARLLHTSILSGEVAPPLDLKSVEVRISYVPGGYRRQRPGKKSKPTET